MPITHAPVGHSHFSHLPSPITYREDINGLRAYAILAVLLFHFSWFGLPGGFIGVDVFFVISGYLMTGIVVGGYLKGGFSVVRFYMARARRILPALMVLVTTLLLIGWFYLPTPDYQALGKESAYAISMLSNVGFFKSAGYFDAAAHEKWLLHTWSLAVEAQFYLLFPLFIAAVWRYRRGAKAVTVAMLMLFCISLTNNLYVTDQQPAAAFYLLPSRAWELAAGGLVYMATYYRWMVLSRRRIGYWLGWVMLLLGMVLIHESLAWPGYFALVPVIGTSMIILGHNEKCILTNNLMAQWLGDRSYSLYLWHWPLVVALYFTGLQNDGVWVVGAFGLSLLLAQLSYRLVEVPTRQYLSNQKLHREVLLISMVALCIVLAAVTVKQHRFEGRIDAVVDAVANAALDSNPRKSVCHDKANQAGTPSCAYGQGPVSAIVWGDSHANALISAVGEVASGRVLEWSFSGCPSLLGAESTPWRVNASSFHCLRSVQWVNEQLHTKDLYPHIPLVIITRTSHYLLGKLKGEADAPVQEQGVPHVFFSQPILDASDAQLQKEFTDAIVSTACSFQKNRQVFLVRPIPEMRVNVPKTLSRNLLLSKGATDIKLSLGAYYARHKLVWDAQDVAARKCGVKLLNPLPYLCDDQYCYGSRDGQPLYYDDDHLSEYGNKLLKPMFEQVFE